MGTFLNILLDILAILVIIVVGSLVVVIIAELILHLLDGGKNKKDDTEEDVARVVSDDDIVVYTNRENPNNKEDGVKSKKTEADTIDGDKIEEIDYEKAAEEQKMLQSKQQGIQQQTASVQKQTPAPKPQPQPKPVEKAPKNDEVFWDNDEDEEFNKFLDEVVKEAKKSGTEKVEKNVEESEKKAEKQEEVVVQKPVEKKGLDDETKKELEELKVLKAQQQKEIEEFKQLKEDFAREKEEQLAMLKDNLNKAKEEELERIKQEALKEQEKLEKLQEKLDAEREQLEEEKAKLKEEKDDLVKEEKEPLIKETIIKDEEELNKLKYKNIIRMNNRLTRIIRDSERLQVQQQKEMARVKEEKQKLLEKQQQEKAREQERLVELERQEQEKLRKEKESQEKKNEIERKLQEASKRAGKYKLDSKVVRLTKDKPMVREQITDVIEEKVVTTTETIPHSDTMITTVEKVPMKSTVKPVFAKEYYEDKLAELEEELKFAEKELRANKAEYIPLTRIHKAYARDGEKLRKKEMQVAKQKVALYGVNSKNIDPVKKEKLDENIQALAELKDSVHHCEEVIKKNKDRYPIIEKNNQLITKQIDRINEDIKVCEKALDYYKKHN